MNSIKEVAELIRDQLITRTGKEWDIKSTEKGRDGDSFQFRYYTPDSAFPGFNADKIKWRKVAAKILLSGDEVYVYYRDDSLKQACMIRNLTNDFDPEEIIKLIIGSIE